METILKVENLSKQYRLGTIGTGTLSHDINRWWYKIRGKEDPYLKIGQTNDRTTRSENNYVWALQDIDFEVNKGDILGVIGRNGAGKSTLLKILSKVTGPTKGNIYIKGRIASLLEVGTGMHPELTGRENIYLNGAILGMTRREVNKKLDEIIDFSGCERYVDTPLKRYSSGMMVRLGFAVAAFLEPEILIVDEVLAVGDAEFQKKAIGKMNEVSNESGRTILFVSHSMSAIKSLCTKGLVMHNGQIYYSGSIESSVEKYVSMAYSEVNTIPLSERKDRKGDRSIVFKQLKLYNQFNQEVKYALNGESIKIKLEYEKENKPLKNVMFWMQLRLNNEIICTLNNNLTDNLFHIEDNLTQGTVTCEISKVPFMAGTYTVYLLCIVNGVFADYVEDAAIIEIEDGNYYGTGRLPQEKKGVLVDHVFSI